MMMLKRTLSFLMLLAAPLGAQTATISAGYALAHYSEQASTLSFDGSGPDASVAVGWWRLEAFGDWQQLGLVPHSGSTLQSFTMTDLTAGIRVHVAPLVSVEAGYQHRGVSPTGTAESFSALRMTARTDLPLAPGAVATVRAGYVGTLTFSGGGTAPMGLDLGLGFGYGPGSGRVQIVGRYDFERIDRHTVILTASHAVPIESSVGQLGLAVRL
jgi:hypothetical protein